MNENRNGNTNLENQPETNSSTASSTTIAGGDPAKSTPAGTFLTSSGRSEEPASENKKPFAKKRPRPNSPSLVFRQDYRKHGRISYLEAADYAGVCVRTIQNWICRRKNRLPVCARVGAYRINLLELDQFLRRGMPR